MNKDNRKIIIHKLGESFRDCTRIEPASISEPGHGEILVQNHFAGVNGVYDQMMCMNRVEHTTVVPPTDTGVEAVGIVEAVGPGVSAFEAGQSVATVNVGGGYREWQVCPVDSAFEIPEAQPDILALIPSGVSALLALERVGDMRGDEVVCITAAAGGLGNIMTQLAVNAGNTVVAVCGSDAKADWLSSIGVQRVIQYRRESVPDVIRKEYADGLDLVMDSVGGDLFDVLVENLAPFGRLVVCGYTSDRTPTEKVSQERIYTQLLLESGVSARIHELPVCALRPTTRAKRLLNMYARGEIVPLVDESEFAGLEAVPDAVEYLLSGKNMPARFSSTCADAQGRRDSNAQTGRHCPGTAAIANKRRPRCRSFNGGTRARCRRTLCGARSTGYLSQAGGRGR